MYLRAYEDGREARVGIGDYFLFCNTERPHQALGYLIPAEVFLSTAVETATRGMVESLAATPLRKAEPHLNLATILS